MDPGFMLSIGTAGRDRIGAGVVIYFLPRIEKDKGHSILKDKVCVFVCV